MLGYASKKERDCQTPSFSSTQLFHLFFRSTGDICICIEDMVASDGLMTLRKLPEIMPINGNVTCNSSFYFCATLNKTGFLPWPMQGNLKITKVTNTEHVVIA